MSKVEVLERKIHKVIEELVAVRRDNGRLRSETETLKSHVSMLTSENAKAQKILAEHEQWQRTKEQVAHRVERALQRLTSLR